MLRRGAAAALMPMAHDDEPNAIVSERFERRLSEECGQMRVEMTQLRGELRTEMAQLRGEMRSEMAKGFGGLRAEMIDRNATLLKWLLLYAVTQTAAIAALFRLFR